MRAHASAKTYRRGLMLFIAVLAVAVFAGQALAEEPVSILTASSGEVSVVRHSSDPGQAFPPRAGMRQVLYVGDVIKTGPGAKAKLLVGDDSLVVLSEETELKIKQVVDEPASGQRSTNVSVAQGYVRVAFQPLEGSGPSPRFTIETPSATITAQGSCEGLVMVSEGAPKRATFWSLENTWEVASTDPAASGAVRIPQGHSTEILAGNHPGSPEPVSQPKLAELRDPMTMRETALTRPTPSIDRGDFIYHNYDSGGWLFASRPKRYKTAAAPSKKPSYAGNGGMNGQGSSEAAPLEPIAGSISLVSAVPQGVLSALHTGFTSIFSENGN